MANNGKPTRHEKWRTNIKTSMLLNRLGDNAFGNIELTQPQIKSIEILLKKTMPDLKSVEHSGIDGEPIRQSLVVEYVDSKGSEAESE